VGHSSFIVTKTLKIQLDQDHGKICVSSWDLRDEEGEIRAEQRQEGTQCAAGAALWWGEGL
jgi:hypothetical protein